MEQCLICAYPVDIGQNDSVSLMYCCPRCGLLKVGVRAAAMLTDFRLKSPPEKVDAVSHLARRWQRAENVPLQVNDYDVDRWYREAELATPSEQARNLIVWLGMSQRKLGDPASLVKFDTPVLASIVGGRSKITAIEYLLGHAKRKCWVEDCDITGMQTSIGVFTYRLTFEGWERFDELIRANEESKTAFMAMAFGDPVLNNVYAECFVPAVDDAGFKLRRLDEGQGAGLIDNQLRVAIRTAKFLVADLSTKNRGAYWEAGFAEGLGKHVIYVCDRAVFSHDEPSERPHFDTNHLVTVTWTLDQLGKARSDLAATIRNTFPAEAEMP